MVSKTPYISKVFKWIMIACPLEIYSTIYSSSILIDHDAILFSSLLIAILCDFTTLLSTCKYFIMNTSWSHLNESCFRQITMTCVLKLLWVFIETSQMTYLRVHRSHLFFLVIEKPEETRGSLVNYENIFFIPL